MADKSLSDIIWEDFDSISKGAGARVRSVGGLPDELAGATRNQTWSWRQPPGRSILSLYQAYQNNPYFRAVVRKIGFHFAMVPWRLYQKVGKASGIPMRSKELKTLKGRYRKDFLSKSQRAGEVEEIESHPFLDLWNNPCPHFSDVTFRQLSLAYYDVGGEMLWWKKRKTPGKGPVVELWPMSPSWLTQLPRQGETTRAPYYRFTVFGQTLELDATEVFYMAETPLENPYSRGTGTGSSLGDGIDTFQYTQEFLKALFYNNALPDVFVGLKGAGEEQVKRFQEQLENRNRGSRRSGRAFVYDSGDEGGNMSVTQLNNNLKQLEALPLMDNLRDLIVSVYGVPPEIMGILTHSNRATIEQALAIFSQEVLIPRLEVFRSEVQRQLVAEFDDIAVLEYDDPTPKDNTFTLEVVKAFPSVATVAELRQLADLAQRGDEDDVFLVPQGITFQDSYQSAMDAAKVAAAKPPPPHGFPPPSGGGTDAPPAPDSGPSDAPKGGTTVTKTVTKADDEGEIDDVLEAVEGDDMAETLSALWTGQIQGWGDDTLQDVGVDTSFNLENPRVKAHLKEFAGKRIKGLVNDTTISQLRAELADGVEAGEGIDDLADRVDSVFDFAEKYRAVRIARTEVIRSSNFATVEAYRESGVVEGKQWVATPDGRTRDEHNSLNGTVVGLDEDFEIDGDTADAPGDFDVPELDINCRCTVVSASADESRAADYTTKAYEKFDKKALAWEHQAQSAIKTAFAKQRGAVHKALKRSGLKAGRATAKAPQDTPAMPGEETIIFAPPQTAGAPLRFFFYGQLMDPEAPYNATAPGELRILPNLDAAARFMSTQLAVQVFGQVREISPAQAKALDRMEAPQFRRELITLTDGTTAFAYAYREDGFDQLPLAPDGKYRGGRTVVIDEQPATGDAPKT